MFSGVSTLSLDDKGRLTVPSKHRDALMAMCAGRLVLTLSPDGCLLVYPEANWLPVRDQMMQLTGSRVAIARMVLGFAEEVEMDKAGRISVSRTLRDKARLEKDVSLVGMGKKFELWDAAKFDELTQATMDIPADELATQMEGIAL
ncbi:MraZ protein [Chitinivorax tropicus]|uniref:Transcriptional regulator MraZ n=1 Tax=Chitinivorax tropicus TaxID=714531 RepID=A0A840MI10_9PROT|nr:division/cell wall cluster transcriptional repressor MraZ [Chitinivorax tropicus]MBB5018844.1 MraZ protein [Chitinivorax tropicus]